ERMLDLLPVGLRRPLEQCVRGEQEARGAEAALGAVVLVERSLDVSEPLRRAEALDGRDLGPVDRGDGQQAGAPRLAADEHRAGPAAALLTAGLRARDPELVAQDVEERPERWARDLALDAVDGEFHRSPS